MKTKTISSLILVVLGMIFLCISHSANGQSLKKEELIGMRFKGYKDKAELEKKLGFWSGARSFYGKDNKLIIERWENGKTKDLWLVLVEELDNGETVICDVLAYSLNSIVDIGPFEIYDSKNKKEYSGYVMVQIAKDDKVMKIFDVDLNAKKIIAKDPESDSVKAQTEWDSY